MPEVDSIETKPQNQRGYRHVEAAREGPGLDLPGEPRPKNGLTFQVCR
jgi:hypothetical protein